MESGGRMSVDGTKHALASNALNARSQCDSGHSCNPQRTTAFRPMLPLSSERNLSATARKQLRPLIICQAEFVGDFFNGLADFDLALGSLSQDWQHQRLVVWNGHNRPSSASVDELHPVAQTGGDEEQRA